MHHHTPGLTNNEDPVTTKAAKAERRLLIGLQAKPTTSISLSSFFLLCQLTACEKLAQTPNLGVQARLLKLYCWKKVIFTLEMKSSHSLWALVKRY